MLFVILKVGNKWKSVTSEEQLNCTLSLHWSILQPNINGNLERL